MIRPTNAFIYAVALNESFLIEILRNPNHLPTMNIYVHKDGTQYGPYTLEQLQQYVQQGSFSLQDQACHDGQNWVRVGQVPGMAQPATSAGQKPASGASKSIRSGQRKSTSKQGQTQPQSSAKPSQGSSKKIILWGAIGGGLAIIVTVVCLLLLSGEEEEKTTATAEPQKETESKSMSSSETETDEPASVSTSVALPSVPMLERISSDAGAVILIRINDLLTKGEKDILALLPPGLPPMVSKALEDPSSLGLDVSEPLQIHLISHEDANLSPTGGLAGKLSDKQKFMTTIELLAGLEAPQQKDGYLLYQPIAGTEDSELQIAIGSDFFFAGGAKEPSDREPSIERFMIADGEDGLLAKDESFSAFSVEKNDLSVWFGGDAILQSVGSQLDGADLGMLEGGSGKLNLNFEDGEMVAQMDFQTPNDEMSYGKGSFSNDILSFAPSDALLSLGFAMDLGKFIKFAEKEILPEVGQELKLDEPVEELGGLTMRDAIDSFTGEFLLSLTDVKMPDPSAMGGLPGGPPADTETDPFGNDALTPGEADPFGDPDMQGGGSPFPGPDGGPAGGMDPAAMIMGAMPKPEFIIAASIDTEKWLKLKAAPPLAMGLGLAMMQGISITEKNDFLLLASKDHIQATQSGSVGNPISGAGKEMFEKNDFVLKINVAPILKMDFPLPPGGPLKMMERISHLEIASNSEKSSGSGTMKLAFANQNENSLSILLQMIKVIQDMQPTPVLVDELEMEGDFQFE